MSFISACSLTLVLRPPRCPRLAPRPVCGRPSAPQPMSTCKPELRMALMSPLITAFPVGPALTSWASAGAIMASLAATSSCTPSAPT
eukprot:2592050-Pyramimonas_sp.AAC.1